MAYKYVAGTGLVNTPEPIVVKTEYVDKLSNAERASQLPDDKQNQQYVNDGNANHLASAIAEQVAKHELVGTHTHAPLKPGDNDPAEQLDENGVSTADELVEGDPEYRDELDDLGNEDTDELSEGDAPFSMGVPKIGKSVFVPMFNAECEVAAYDDDFVTVKHAGLTKSLTIDEVMPA